MTIANDSQMDASSPTDTGLQQAVILAAGEGSRLRPLTERVPKPLLPIDGEAVIERVLCQLGAIGITATTIVTGHQGDVLRTHLQRAAANRTDWPKLDFARQPERHGSAHALQCARAHGFEAVDAVVTAADTWWQHDDVERVVSVWREQRPAVAMGLRRWPVDELPHRSVCQVDERGRVLRVVEKPGAATLAEGSGLAGSPIYVFSAGFWPYVDAIQPDEMGLVELAVGLQRAVDDGLDVLGVEVTATRDLTRPDDLLRHNFPWLADILD